MAESQEQKQWRIKVAAGEFGPVDLETLRAWVQQGRVTPRDFVLSPETNAWVPAGNVPQLAGLFPPPTAQGPFPPAPPKKKRWWIGCLIAAAIAAFVIVVLSILAGMLLPALARAREMARRTACLSNLKQHGLALDQYSQDFKGKFPWRVGAEDVEDAWLDLGMLFPDYNSSWESFLCPSSKDRIFSPICSSGDKQAYPSEPLKWAGSKAAISYGYGYARPWQGPCRPWSQKDQSTVRLMADKKAGYPIGHAKNPDTEANHKGDGRNVLYHDGHVKWTPGPWALDPDEDSDRIGKPNAANYADWWSDPPFYGEGMEEEESDPTE